VGNDDLKELRKGVVKHSFGKRGWIEISQSQDYAIGLHGEPKMFSHDLIDEIQ